MGITDLQTRSGRLEHTGFVTALRIETTVSLCLAAIGTHVPNREARATWMVGPGTEANPAVHAADGRPRVGEPVADPHRYWVQSVRCAITSDQKG